MWRLGGIIVSAGGFLADHNGAVTAVATVFIAAFTIVLALVTGRQARLTDKLPPMPPSYPRLWPNVR